MKYFTLILALIVVSGVAVYLVLLYRDGSDINFNTNFEPESNTQSENIKKNSNNNNNDITEPIYKAPLDRVRERISYKPFGIKITPENSPVQPERFSGYHTGADFEIFPDELSQMVTVFAFCDGPIIQKGYASGYGGYAVQSCTLENESVTVIYGHLKVSSILQEDLNIKPGQQIGLLGDDKSQETDFERKHLHFAIHKGQEINLRGYVSSEFELINWLDPMDYLENL